MQSNFRMNLTFVAVLLASVLLAATPLDAQGQNPSADTATGAQCRALTQAVQASAQAGGTQSLTPAEAQLMVQCLALRGQSGAPPTPTSAQSQVQGVAGPGQPNPLALAVRGSSQSFSYRQTRACYLNCAEPEWQVVFA